MGCQAVKQGTKSKTKDRMQSAARRWPLSFAALAGKPEHTGAVLHTKRAPDHAFVSPLPEARPWRLGSSPPGSCTICSHSSHHRSAMKSKNGVMRHCRSKPTVAHMRTTCGADQSGPVFGRASCDDRSFPLIQHGRQSFRPFGHAWAEVVGYTRASFKLPSGRSRRSNGCTVEASLIVAHAIRGLARRSHRGANLYLGGG